MAIAKSPFESLHDAMTIYDQLYDNESKKLFEMRCNFMLSGNEYGLFRELYQIGEAKWTIPYFDAWLASLEKLDSVSPNDRRIYIFGSKQYGEMSCLTLQKAGFTPTAFIDNDESRHNETLLGLPILPLSAAIEQGSGFCVVIAVIRGYEQIHYQLIANHISRLHIWFDFSIKRLFAQIGHQYFDFFASPRNEDESIGFFLDCGCYDLTNTFDFIEWSKGYYSGIIAFEPDSRNYKICEDILSKDILSKNKLEKVTLLNKGLWKEDATVLFEKDNDASHIIDSPTKTRVGFSDGIDVTSIDNVCQGLPSDVKVGFIKMDIEGAELPALQGASDTIISCKPKLAISIYHKKEDFLEIPLFIQSLRKDYQFALRHYTNNWCDTVLYGW
jgi:FkbM family methyltransferase